MDHIIPLSSAPELAHEELNCRMLCRRRNSERQDHCTDLERAQVLAAIENRRQHRRRHQSTN
ncbi:MAG: HNH endonuclease [Mycobacterium sp.]|nr:HNH endonuclease [Mycobacterium sp.]